MSAIQPSGPGIGDPFPISEYPPLNPENFSEPEAFLSLQKPQHQIIEEAKSDDQVHVAWQYAPAKDGHQIPLLIYESKDRARTGESGRPLFFAIHGGGWISGDFSVEDGICRRAVKDLDCVAASVHYRLSPESRFPIPLHDCLDALHYLVGIDSLSFDRKRLIIGGTSAGASLACGMFQLLREELATSIRGLLLNTPVTCDTLHFPPEFPNLSWHEHSQAPVLSACSMSFCFDQFFPSRAPEPLISPLISPDLGRFPPCVITCAERDPLRDQGLALANALEMRGIPVRSKLYRKVPHGFHLFSGLPEAEEAIKYLVDGMAWMLTRKTT